MTRVENPATTNRWVHRSSQNPFLGPPNLGRTDFRSSSLPGDMEDWRGFQANIRRRSVNEGKARKREGRSLDAFGSRSPGVGRLTAPVDVRRREFGDAVVNVINTSSSGGSTFTPNPIVSSTSWLDTTDHMLMVYTRTSHVSKAQINEPPSQRHAKRPPTAASSSSSCSPTLLLRRLESHTGKAVLEWAKSRPVHAIRSSNIRTVLPHTIPGCLDLLSMAPVNSGGWRYR
ncbi:uncharacterized protein ARMOST_18300 [Armillaria ostoyae]|uniref:Uncharacterized protein n=1 Tax=Armillaria ostoyae TaxID=47428 RepID=A0A284S1F7_ARMOS|nr:uncharacterized protein ARMOST_18300 [Armillaria ostoyae]